MLEELAPGPPLPDSKVPDPVPLWVLLQHHGAEFVRIAHQAILNRPPDPGLDAFYTSLVDRGDLTRIEVAGLMRYGTEGRRIARPVPGLRVRYLLWRAVRRPVLGRLVAAGLGLYHMTHTMQTIERLERQEQALATRVRLLEQRVAQLGAAAALHRGGRSGG